MSILSDRLEPNDDLKVSVQKKTESDLLKKLKSIAVETDEAKEASEVAGSPTSHLASLFGAMKVSTSTFLPGQYCFIFEQFLLTHKYLIRVLSRQK
jgi:hypothetical protein